MAQTDDPAKDRVSPSRRQRTAKGAWLDLLLIAGLLTAANWFTTGPDDWGWMRINPTPWLLLPLFLGIRYGFGYGMGSGLLAAVIVLAGRAWPELEQGQFQSAQRMVMDHLYYFLALPGVGFLAGETHGLLARKLAAAQSKVQELSESTERLESERDIAEEARHQLQERLALHGAEQSNLDRQLRALFEPQAGLLFPNVLRLLREVSGVTDAGIYAVDRGRLSRIAALGEVAKLPETIFTAELEIARVAVERRTLVTCKEVWQETPEFSTPFLAALPWSGRDGVAALLLIHRMRFLDVTWRNFHRIEMICRWIARFIDLRAQVTLDSTKPMVLLVPPAAMQETVQQAVETHRNWQLPSTMAEFAFTEPVPENVARLLPQTVGAVMRSTDVASFAGDGGRPVLKVLIPMEGAAGAQVFIDDAMRAIARTPKLAGKVAAHLSITNAGIKASA